MNTQDSLLVYFWDLWLSRLELRSKCRGNTPRSVILALSSFAALRVEYGQKEHGSPTELDSNSLLERDLPISADSRTNLLLRTGPPGQAPEEVRGIISCEVQAFGRFNRPTTHLVHFGTHQVLATATQVSSFTAKS